MNYLKFLFVFFLIFRIDDLSAISDKSNVESKNETNVGSGTSNIPNNFASSNHPFISHDTFVSRNSFPVEYSHVLPPGESLFPSIIIGILLKNKTQATPNPFIKPHIKKATVRDYARTITSLVVEAYLVGRLTKIAATFAKSSKAKVLIQAGKIAQKTPEIVGLTAEGVPVEAAIVKRGGLDLCKTVNEKFIGTTAEVLDGTRYICAEIETLNHLKPEIEHLKILFDGTRSGFGEFAHKTIKIPYAHILGPEFNTTRRGIRLSGFHHDFNQVLEKSGIFKFTEKVIGEHGVYEAEVWYNGFQETKTFFPSDWSREKVMSKILEAYDSFKASGASGVIDQGKYFVKGSTNEGISVEMYITLSGKLTTAYPTL